MQSNRVVGTIIRVTSEHVLERLRVHGRTFLIDAVMVTLGYAFADELRFDGKIPGPELRYLLLAVPLVVFVSCVLNYLYGIHRRIWAYATVRDARALLDASLVSGILIGILDIASGYSHLTGENHRLVPLAVVPAGCAFALLGLTVVRFGPRFWRAGPRAKDDANRVVIVGAGHAGQMVAGDLLSNPHLGQHPIGFVDDDPRKRKMRIQGLPVLGSVDDLPRVVSEYGVDIVGVAIPSASASEMDRVLALAQETTARIQVLPSHADIMAGKAPVRLKDISLDDLLDRAPSSSPIEMQSITQAISGRVVLVTGARGSIGFELCRQLLQLGPSRVLALDNNETGLFYLQRELSREPNAELVTPILADITDESKLTHVFRRYGPDIVFHAAAYKHVPLLESHPEEAVFVNVEGTLNLCRQASEHGCERFVFVSTDKAVDPVNVLGFSKRIGEMVVRAHEKTGTVFCSVRFGNVIASRGSALPEFIHQINAGGPVTITHPDVERYLMTISEAVSLVIQAGAYAQGGEIFMLDMGEPVKIGDLAKRIIRMRGLRIGKDIEIVYTGLRPGEKLTEELVSEVEYTEPTSNPSIYVVRDGLHVNRDELRHSIAELSDVARHGEVEEVHAALALLANGHRVARQRAHLSSVTFGRIAGQGEARGARRGLERRSGRDRRTGNGGWAGMERRRGDRRRSVSRGPEPLTHQELPA